MSTTFQREANSALKDAGYRYERTSGNAHEVWVKTGVPDIHVPGTPSGGRDSMMARLRRAIRKGTPLSPPSGQEIDVPKAPAKAEESMADKLMALASAHMTRKAQQRAKKHEAGIKGRLAPDMDYPSEVTKWVRRCIETHGAIPNSAFAVAAGRLQVSQPEMSEARKRAQAASYRMPGELATAMKTDFRKRIPEGAVIAGQTSVKRSMPRPVSKRMTDVRVTFEPPNGNEGRRLEQGGLTADEHAEAERRMVEGHRRAEEERAAILARREGTVDAVVGETTNGKKSQLDAAMELLREAALADTHALTEEDIRSLEGLQETFRRHSQESLGAVGQITLILKRVNQREGVPA